MKLPTFIITVIGALTLYAASSLSAVNQQEWDEIKTGEIVISEKTEINPDGTGNTHFTAKLFIKADRKTVWDILRDYEKYPEYFPNVQETIVVKREGETYWVFFHTKMLWSDAKYTLRFDGVEKYRRIEGAMDKERQHTINDMISSWQLDDAPNGSGTVVSYSIYIDSGIPAPAAISRKAVKKSLPELVENVRKRVESGGKWKKSE